MDLKPTYDKIMGELGFVHQHCTFHLLQNIYDTINPELTKLRKDYELKLKKNGIKSLKHTNQRKIKTIHKRL